MRRRLTAACLGLAIVVGSAVLWIGIPLGGFWVAGKVASHAVDAVLFALLAVPLTMVAFGWVLYRVNELYERVRGGPYRPPTRSAWLVSSSDERAKLRRARAPRSLIDVAMTASAVTAMALLVFWFFFLAHGPITPLP